MRKNLIGQKFGRLTVIDYAEDHVSSSGYHTIMWKCRCECGAELTVRGKCLTQGVTKSCGCYQKEGVSQRASKHHGFGTRLYAVWNSMRQRCLNPHSQAYKNYGGRGITICSEWEDFAEFRTWALSNGYDETALRGELTLDRIDVNQGYSPVNCRWVSTSVQAHNKRNTLLLTYQGVTKPLTEWAKEVGLHYTTLWKRYSVGMTPEQILSI